MTLLSLSVRAYRTGTIASALICAIAGLVNGVGYVEIAGTTPAERLAFAHQMELLGRQLSYLLPQPVQLETLGGYLTWRSFGSLAIVYAVWGLFAGTGAGRGDEDKGLVDAWLAAGVSRARWIASRAVAFVLVATGSIGAGLAVTAIGAAIVQESLPVGGLVPEGIAMLALTLVGFGLGLLVAQISATRRSASAIGGVILIAAFSLNAMLRAGADPGVLKWLSPFYLFDRSAPLLQGGSLDGPATFALFAATIALVVVATWAFARRDIGSALLRASAGTSERTARPATDPLLRVPVLAGLDQQRGWIAGWAIGLAALAYFMTSLARTMVDSFKEIPTLQVYFERAGIGSYADVVGIIWFSNALLLLSFFVVAQVNGWAADDAEGRLETTLAAGASRTRVVLERIATLLVAAAIVTFASTGAIWLATQTFAVAVPADRLLVATLLLLPVTFALGAVGHALAGWRPRLAVLLLGTIAVVSYFVQQFVPLFGWPDWVAKLSVFTLYGQPVSRVDWTGAATLLAIGVAGTAAALVSMQRRDVGR